MKTNNKGAIMCIEEKLAQRRKELQIEQKLMRPQVKTVVPPLLRALNIS
jgi:hypothetical protein